MSHRLFALIVVVLSGAPLLVQATDAAAIARQGNGKGAPPCMACHGADGAGQAATGNPRLAGLHAAYLRKQLDDFASGARESTVMKPAASALSEDERQALARYYSKLPLPPGLAKPETPMPLADSVGAVLATRGDWSRDVPGCVQCHGPAGVGVGTHFPPLAGQSATYIAAQLKAWQNGARHNDPLQLMQHLAKALSAQEIDAVATWFAAQPLPAKGATP
ncbi:MAG: cytochrome c4 [Rhodanobacter sp.]|nr:MAG: cytochrome c4 [Rhodanobacter sp.]TAM42796.1 MAG: cytochrome c4 [Rhodanobacter sp.]TAN28001.1 MAG: cytochrome c4 [Rhodanobacter sp.]